MYTDLSAWWDALHWFERMYWIIAVPFTVLLLLQLLLTFFGGDIDTDFDTDHRGDFDSDHGFGFHFLSIKNLISFFTVFSWSGLACIHWGLPKGITILVSLVCGLIMMLIMASLFYSMTRLTHSGTLNLKNAIGNVGDVYLTIPAKKDGMGKVQIKVQGALRTLDAMTADTEDIKTGNLVEVIDVINDNLLIVKRSR